MVCDAGAGANLTTLEFVGFSLSVGFYGAIGIVAGHELCHKTGGSSVLWVAAHVRGVLRALLRRTYARAPQGRVHRQDAATARYGENFHTFLPGNHWGV